MALGFLDLPAEIRNQIYHLALVREAGQKIALWPEYSHDEDRRGLYTLPIPRHTAFEKQAVLAKYYPDLLYVRKELAVGLLATCRQVHDEAAWIFWSGNHFSFSGYFGWHVLLRFLSTIGEDARVHLRCLSIAAPFFSMKNPPVDRIFVKFLDEYNIYASEMRLTKAYPGLSVWEPVPIGELCEILETFRKIKTVSLVVPRGQRMHSSIDFEERCTRLRLLKITLSLEIVGTLYTEWNILENLSWSGALTLASGSIINTWSPMPFQHAKI